MPAVPGFAVDYHQREGAPVGGGHWQHRLEHRPDGLIASARIVMESGAMVHEVEPIAFGPR